MVDSTTRPTDRPGFESVRTMVDEGDAFYARQVTVLDPTYFVLEGTPGTAAELFGNLAGQLGLDPEMAPETQAQIGNFSWNLYTFERRGNVADLAMAEDGEKAYFVFMVSTPEEHDVLLKQLFEPAVEAMAPISAKTE